MTFLLSLCAFGTLTAQEIQVGDFFNNLGSLRNASKEWKANGWPLKLVLMYYNGKTTINGNAMNWRIQPDAAVGLPMEEVKLVVGQGRSWAALKYDFTAAGSYTIRAYDKDWKELATTTITIEGPKRVEPKPEPVKPVAEAEPKPVKEEVKPVETTAKPAVTKEELLENAPEPVFVESVITEELNEEEKKTLMFESFYMEFGRTIQSGMLMGQNEKFKAMPGGLDLQALFSNNEGFGTERIGVDIWMKPPGAKEFTEHITELTVAINKDVTQANFPIHVRDRGTYKISLFTDEMVWIGSGYFSLY